LLLFLTHFALKIVSLALACHGQGLICTISKRIANEPWVEDTVINNIYRCI
jgi:hypothetical protein